MNDDVLHLLKIFEVALIASVKFAISPFEAERYGFNFKEAFLITTTGGTIGIILFSLVGEVIAFGWRKTILFFEKPLHIQEKPKKKFTWFKRFIIRTKMRFGIFGLVITTPSIISIPIGAFVIHRLYKNKYRNILFLTISLIFWSLILNGVAQYLHLSQYIPK
jgi:hypothetical protein